MKHIRWVAATIGAALVATTVINVVGTPQASAAPAFQMPFPCGQTWSGSTRSYHSPARAVDFNRSNDYGDRVEASASGTVARVENEGNTSYGRWIEINHGDGWRSRYAHLSVQAVSVGQRVSKGQRIGNVGSTGGSTGPHLHFEQRYNGTAVKIRFNGSYIYYYGTRSYTSRNCGGSSNPYTPREVCGSAYSVIDSASVGSRGRVYLLYNNGWNCVVTLKTSNLGSASSMSAHLEPRNGSRSTDSGQFSYYAGPVKKYAPGVCVRWGGSIGSASYSSPWEHCG
ncbi:M23 family metallopeptidase [Actinophytocola sp.]|uniref:M23 family metallopeptidase n=1 Tax=Actinophytocola sp. TaxID=1872138 RepID=UPI003D6AD35B